ncbi:citramalate synthase [Algisphaera agarilytica]|uniref:Citramalate synthase n=1 Tax=Algisphaera agarilytica TaxID=1385975 RepID=A0A7X0H7T7_9BACT|nr:citramalate synthase [Algisphaera agarilytica]MBB6430872.1 2-isopropylmalate synthase [Algisphaera agarilytica]
MASPENNRRIEIYDTTLRDGTQGVGVSLTLTDKLAITQLLDEMGVDFVEGGYPLSNPKDVAYFEEVQKLELKHTRVCAFGMTRRKGIDPADDQGMQALVNSGAPIITIVGKTWDLHVDEVLRISREENLAMIRDSVAFCRSADSVQEVFYDAEHFFDGYRANPEYARQTLQAAIDGGATRLVLCDTNGGSMTDWVTQVMAELKEKLAVDADTSAESLPSLAIHCHNDAGLAVANSQAAVAAGAVQVQGTINGIGERCGNVDLLTVIANLKLKLGYDCLIDGAVARLGELSDAVYEKAAVEPNDGQPYVGDNAFAHKGGMHVHAVQRIAHSYEHVEPESVGNQRRILVSELSGRSNIAATLGQKFGDAVTPEVQTNLLTKVQDLEHRGYQFEHAPASLELLMYEAIGQRPSFWVRDHYRCVILGVPEEPTQTEAIVKLTVGDEVEHRVAEGDGPVNALDAALRKALRAHYPQIDELTLTDYAVRVVNPTAQSAAKVRATAEFEARGVDGNLRRFSTIGVDENIVDASWQALSDAIQYYLIEVGAEK